MSHGKTPASRKVVVWLSALLGVALTAGLGVWQLQRADQKREMAQAFESRRTLPAWGNADWPCTAPGEAALPTHRPARLRGYWLHDKTIVLDNRPMDGLPGFIVVTPLKLSSDGRCGQAVVLVQRGWLPRDVQDRRRVPSLPADPREVEVPGEVLASLSATYALGQEPLPNALDGSDASDASDSADNRRTEGASHRPLIRQNADASFWMAWLGTAPLPGVLQQTQLATPADAAMLLRHWPVPGFGRDRHLAYAAQWFALSGVLAGLTLWYQFKARVQHAPA